MPFIHPYHSFTSALRWAWRLKTAATFTKEGRGKIRQREEIAYA